MLFSAKRRRKRLGIRKATPKASASAPVPKKKPFVASRIRPMTRERSVRIDSLMPDFTIFFSFFFTELMIEYNL